MIGRFARIDMSTFAVYMPRRYVFLNLQLYISQSWRALFHVHFSTTKKRSLQSRSLQLNRESTPSPWKRLRCFRLSLQSPCWCRDLCVSHSNASSSPSNRSWQRSSCRCAGERRWEEHFDQTFGGKICRFLHGIRETGSSLKIGQGGSLETDNETLEKCWMPAIVCMFFAFVHCFIWIVFIGFIQPTFDTVLGQQVLYGAPSDWLVDFNSAVLTNTRPDKEKLGKLRVSMR